MTTSDDTTTVRLSGRQGLLAAIPALLGFHPTESMVMVCLSGPRRRVGPVVRVDLTDFTSAAPGREPPPLAALRSHARRHADEVALVCYTEGPADSEPMVAVIAALRRSGTVVVDAAWVRSGRVYSCRPDGAAAAALPDDPEHDEVGRQPPGDEGEQLLMMVAAGVLTGRGILVDRQALHDSIAGPRGKGVAQASAALHAAADRLLGPVGSSGPVGPGRLRKTAATTVERALAQAASSGSVDIATCAMLTLLLCDVTIRDEMIARLVDDLDPPWVPMLIAVARSIPDEVATEVCAVLSVAAYRRGDGALAQVAVDRCLTVEPDHRLAHLMLAVMAAGLPPGELSHLAADGAIRPGTGLITPGTGE